MKNLANQNGYKYIRDIDAFYGELNGYYFYSEKTRYVGLVRIFFTVVNPNLPKIKEIAKDYRALNDDGIRYEGGRLILEVKTIGLDDPQDLGTLLDKITRSMVEDSVKQEVNGVDHDLGLFRDGTHLMVRSAEEFSAEASSRSKIYKKQSTKPAIVGYLMAAVFMIPGSIAYAIALNIGILPAFVSFTVIYLALKGFDRFSGTPSRNQLYVILGISYLGVVLGYYISVAFSLIRLGMGFMIPLLFAAPLTGVLKSALFSFGIGILFNLNSIRMIFNGARTGNVVNRKIRRLL